LFIAILIDTGDKLGTGVIDNSNKLRRCDCYWRKIIAGVVDTGDQALSRIFIDFMTPAIINRQ
jgi:hypothetical protein